MGHGRRRTAHKIPQKRFILIVTDYFTKWVEAESYANIRAEDVEKFVWKNIICRHGLPYEIVTDNGTQFTSATFEKFCASWNIRLSNRLPDTHKGTARPKPRTRRSSPESKTAQDKKGIWADELDGVLWSHRTTPRRSTNQTPFTLSHGIEAMSPTEATIPGLRRTHLPNNA
ncbi:unnamed protein product [Microthlaspi erraticum]|uniref:Integrase catalytic domain-containing protein n=1 Tax=Microthlaspi erraticum TaxID=1685480 RepID=A0A6D2IXS9_9BRAS|nr:unnamed protein product [Microthlaspi erraticum]